MWTSVGYSRAAGSLPVLQGRMMHILPSTIRKDKMEDEDAEESSSYKKRKEAKDKANSARYNMSCQMPRSGRNACGILTGAADIPRVDEAFAVQLCFVSLLPT